MIRQQPIVDYILVRLRRGDQVSRPDLLRVYRTVEVHEAIWHLIEQGLICWDGTNYENLKLAEQGDETVF